MATNFDFLRKDKAFDSFAEQAVDAEKSLMISSSTTAILCRRALELGVRWLYTTDKTLKVPYQDNLSSLIHEKTFVDTLEPNLFPLLKYIVKLGNMAVHTSQPISRDKAVLSLRNLYEFYKWVQYCYSSEYQELEYDESLLPHGKEEKRTVQELQELSKQLSSKDRKLEEMQRENESLREQMSLLKERNLSERNFQIDPETEKETRIKYVDIDLVDAGWEFGRDVLTEVALTGMPNESGTGRADYVLYGNNGLPLAVIEAKRTGVNAEAGSQQAKLYADCLEEQYTQRPFLFTTNGFETYFTDDYNDHPRRKVSGIFSKQSLQLRMDRRISQKQLEDISINNKITDRPYQKEAVIAVCDAIKNKYRKVLIVQATGSGKTRVSVSIVDVLRKHNYIKNILFLADRTALVKQAKNTYNTLLPDLTSCNLLEGKDDAEQSRMVFSTYPTMMNAIDEQKKKDGGRLFTPGHFDLIIIDESHRSIYKKYQEIFDYFDAMLLGMTATPKNEIDKNTYSVFDLERGVPTFAYELREAVKDGYLVNYRPFEYKSKIMENGIHYDELTDEEKDHFEETFAFDEKVDKDISNNAINQWLFNRDTIDMVLATLMEKGLKVEGGDKLGKTIIFAKNSRHAQAITDRFKALFPEYGSYFIAQVDYSVRYADNLIDEFGTKDKNPQIAVSVDMLDTGIDIPEILNLVFFKPVRSFSKFWQMIGRGTRLCKDLFGAGKDKEEFLILDFCNNFEFFRINTQGYEAKIGESLAESIFNCKISLIRELQSAKYSSEEYASYREELVRELHRAVCRLDNASYRVRLHLRQVEKYRQEESWLHLESGSVSELREHIAPLIAPEKENELARRFDKLMYYIELAFLQDKKMIKYVNEISRTAEKLSRIRIPQVEQERTMIEKARESAFWEGAGLADMEAVRESFRNLVQFLERENQQIYYTNFSDEIISIKEGEPVYVKHDLENYRKKVEFYLKKHKDNIAVYKLRQNKRLTKSDLKELERILWSELGTKSDYQREYGDTPIGRLVRRVVGVEREVVNIAFGEFLSEEKLNLQQIRFVKLIVDYIVQNGNIEDNRVLTEEPFRSVGSIAHLFKDDMKTAQNIIGVIEYIRKNSEETA